MQIRLSDRYVTALNFALIAAIAYFAALSADDLIARGVTAGAGFAESVRTARRANAAHLSRASYSVIVERDVFNSVKEAPAPAALPATDLHVKLLGTSQITAAKPFAIMEDTNNHQQALYRLNDEIPDAGTLVAVERKRVLIDHEGQVRSLSISEDVPAVSTPSSVAAAAAQPPPEEQPAAVEDNAAVIQSSRPSPWKRLDPNQPLPWKDSAGTSPHRNGIAARPWNKLRSLGTFQSANRADADD